MTFHEFFNKLKKRRIKATALLGFGGEMIIGLEVLNAHLRRDFYFGSVVCDTEHPDRQIGILLNSADIEMVENF